MKTYQKVLIGFLYGMLPVLLAFVLLRNLGALASLVCNGVGADSALTLQISTALQQLREAKLVLPWLAGLLSGLVSCCLLFLAKSRKGYIALTVVGVLLLLPLTLGAFCLIQVNDVQVAALLRSLLQWL